MINHAFFLLNLVQDVNIVRPLVFMTARDFGAPTTLLVSRDFIHRDKFGIWQEEIEELRKETGARVVIFAQEWEAAQVMQGKAGLLVAASESALSAHTLTHNVLRQAPPGFVKVTLQHGFECVGFLQSKDHILAHGLGVTFGADIVCSWCERERLTSMTPSQASKLYVSGPPFVLQQRRSGEDPFPSPIGLVAENLHSVRLNIQGDFKQDFVQVFSSFCAEMAKENLTVALRPHPGGQYVLKNNVAMPRNAVINNNPIYKVDLSRYAYGISAPSSVIIDMVAAGIPTAVWTDAGGTMDAGNYTGLTTISTLDQWVAFSKRAIAEPQYFLDKQADFLRSQKMPVDPEDVYTRFADLFEPILRPARKPAVVSGPAERVMFVANGLVPTLQLSFLKPLRALVEAGDVATGFLTENDMQERFGNGLHDEAVGDWAEQRLSQFKPTMLVFCRYSGPHYEVMANWARRNDVPMVYQIDDDLLTIPPDIGLGKFNLHNNPKRLASVRHLLDTVDIVYCSTARLEARMRELGVTTPIVVGKIYASGEVIRAAEDRPVRRIGYMASADHAHNLTMILPAIVEFLRANPEVGFELFGSIPKPAELEEFGERITSAPPIRNYDQFLQGFAERNWDVGICPLVAIPFNLMKANTKWVEYTAVGAAVVASAGTVYDEGCADDCGVLAGTVEEWRAALQAFADNPGARFAMVSRAQEKLRASYSLDELRAQVLRLFADVRARAAQREEPVLKAAAE